jgi:hypothetical protein
LASEPAITPAAASDLISFLKALPDCRMRRGIRFPQWWMLLVAILSILSGADFLIAVKHSRRRGFRLIRDRLTYGRRIPWRTSGREVKRGRDISWTLRAMPAPEWVMEQWPGSATIIAVRSQGIRDGKPTDETRYYVWRLRTGAQALLRHVRNRWSIENSWHWVRDVALREDATPIGRTTASRSWPRSAAWRSMPCGSIGDAANRRAAAGRTTIPPEMCPSVSQVGYTLGRTYTFVTGGAQKPGLDGQLSKKLI